MSASTRHTWMGPAALMLAVFVAGVLAGAAGMRLLDRRDAPPPGVRVGQRGGPQFDRDRSGGPEGFFLEQLSERLDLSDAQRAQVDSIVAAQRQKSREVMESLRPRMSASLDSMNQAIAAVLEPDQQDRWERFLAELQSRSERDRRRGGGTRRGPPGF